MKKSSWTEPGSKHRRRSDAAEEPEDPLNPAIPKAPLIPHDIARMPNAALPVWSHPPEERNPERPTLGAMADLRDHVDARPPPGVTPSTYQSAAMPPHTDSVLLIGASPVPGAADPSIRAPRPAPDATTAAESPRPTALERSSRHGWTRAQWSILLALALLIIAGAALWSTGVFN